MYQTAAAQDTLLLAEETVPLEVAQGQLGEALTAQLEVPAFVPPAPVPVSESGGSLVVPLMLAVALVLLFGLRALAMGGKGWIARFVQPATPGPEPKLVPSASWTPKKARTASSRRSKPARRSSATAAPKPAPPPPPRKTVELPPHVAAMLSRMEERRGAGTGPAPVSPSTADPPPEPKAPPATLGDRGLDVVIGS